LGRDFFPLFKLVEAGKFNAKLHGVFYNELAFIDAIPNVQSMGEDLNRHRPKAFEDAGLALSNYFVQRRKDRESR
jgi:hypothetical protein